MTAGQGSGGGAPSGRDRGLQPQRTRLAWRRTTLACTVVAVLAVRAALRADEPVAAALLCAVSCGLWLGFLRIAHHRIRVLSTADRPAALTPRHATAAAVCAAALAVCAAALLV
ncbi:DUF202 domain-containing protein [Streptomyces sp. NPDC048242]|uniref:DUF202 domain-containing protein n=1 Tax=Streptomyces sp. NPDC048242 TaxID=3155026 RepID=UPI003448B010